MIKWIEYVDKDSAFFVYRLKHPITHEVKYIGITNNPKERYRKHKSALKAINLKNNWIKSLLSQGLLPLMEIIDFAETRDLINQKEKYWIIKHNEWDCDLKNMTSGGDGGNTMQGRKLTTEQCKKISLSKIGKPNKTTALTNTLTKSKPVNQICPETKQILNTFPSVRVASEITGCSKTNIAKMASGKIKRTIRKVGGYEWSYN